MPWIVRSTATGALLSLGGMILPSILTPERLRQLIDKEQQQHDGCCEWTDVDYQEAVSNALRAYRIANHANSVEAELGTDSSWQKICDDFAQESGCGLVFSEEKQSMTTLGRHRPRQRCP